MDQGTLAELEAFPERATTVQWMQLLYSYRKLEERVESLEDEVISSLENENEELRDLLQNEQERGESLSRDLELAEEEIENLKERIEDLEEYGND